MKLTDDQEKEFESAIDALHCPLSGDNDCHMFRAMKTIFEKGVAAEKKEGDERLVLVSLALKDAGEKNLLLHERLADLERK